MIDKYYYKCEFCGKDIVNLSDRVEVSVSRNILEDNNPIIKTHIFCGECWDTSMLYIRGEEIQ